MAKLERMSGVSGATAARVLTGIVAVSCAAMTLFGESKQAEAWPKYSTQEKKPCSYCHVKPSGGGRRNDAGTYYATHNHSFAGYTPANAAAGAGGGASEGVTATPTPNAPKPTPKPTPKATTKKTTTTKKPAPKKPAAKKG